MVDDYGYAGIDFHNDPDQVLLEGKDWDAALGKKYVISFHAVVSFYMFCDFIIFFGAWYNKHSVLQIVHRYGQWGCP